MKGTLYVIDDPLAREIGEVTDLNVGAFAERKFLVVDLPETFLQSAEVPPGIPGRRGSYYGFEFVQGFDGYLSAGGPTHES